MGRLLLPDQLDAFLRKCTEMIGDVTDPAIANKRCIHVSGLFRSEHGGRLVVAYGPLNVTGPSEAPGHVAVLKGRDRIIYDWTARQFWPDAACPLIEPLDVWAARFSGYHPELRRSVTPGRVRYWNHGHEGRILVPAPKELPCPT